MESSLAKALETLALHALLIALGTQALMQTLGRVTTAVRPGWYEHEAFRAFVASQNLFLGCLVALLIEDAMGWRHRLLLGLIGGAFSAVIYETVLKRFELTAVKPKATQDAEAHEP